MATDVMALNNSSFVELTNDEMYLVDGGWNWAQVLGGAALVVAAVGLTVATGGIGLVSVSLLLGAGTSGELAVAGIAAVASVLGGAAIGHGMVS